MALVLRENLTFDQAHCVVESSSDLDSTGKPKNLYMKGIFVQGGVKNHNQRFYPVNEIRSAVDQLNESIRRGESVLGEADHPSDLNINLDRVSHMITEMYMEGPNGIGKLKILPTPMGMICRTILENGGKLGVSSRGQGNLNERTGEVSGFQMITVDIVARPSAPEAYPVPVYEALNMRRGAIIEDLAKSRIHDSNVQKHLTKELMDFIRSLKA